MLLGKQSTLPMIRVIAQSVLLASIVWEEQTIVKIFHSVMTVAVNAWVVLMDLVVKIVVSLFVSRLLEKIGHCVRRKVALVLAMTAGEGLIARCALMMMYATSYQNISC